MVLTCPTTSELNQEFMTFYLLKIRLLRHHILLFVIFHTSQNRKVGWAACQQKQGFWKRSQGYLIELLEASCNSFNQTSLQQEHSACLRFRFCNAFQWC